MNVKGALKKQLTIFIAILALNIIIFNFIFNSTKKEGKNLQKINLRKLEDFDTDHDINSESDVEAIIDSDTEINTDFTIITDINTGKVTNNPTNNFNNCSALEFFIDLCNPDNKDKQEDTDYINYILDQIQKGNLNDLFNKTIEEGENFINKDNNITYQISTISSQYSTNLSKVSLEQCETILKDVYSLDKEEQLILLKLEHGVENLKIPVIEYQLFTKDGKKLNLSHCDEIPELVSIPVEINENEEFIHDPKSDFYHDKCYTYTSEYDTDLTIYDRKKNFNTKYLSLCEKNCIYIGYDKSNKTANCECKTKNEFPKFTTEKADTDNILYRIVEESKKFTNFFVLTCTKILFTPKGFKTNFGSYYNIAIFTLIIFFGI